MIEINDILDGMKNLEKIEQNEVNDFTNIVPSLIRERLMENMNCFALFSGEPGSGKSLSAITLARAVDPTFTLKELPNRVVFDTPQLLDLLINEGKNGQKNLPKGSAIILDEAGMQLNARDWQKEAVKDFGKISQTMRFLNYLVIVTLPISLFLEKQSRQLITMQFEAVRTYIDPISHRFYDNRGEFKMYIYEPGLFEGQIFRKFFRAVYHHVEVPFKYVYFARPPTEWEKAYEKLKVAFLFNRYAKMRDELIEESLKMQAKKEKVLSKTFTSGFTKKEEIQGIWLKCSNCGHSWMYTGNMTKYTHCPSCGGRVNIPKSKIIEEVKTK
ncbi:MAG: hypothetical protein ACP5L4_02035 [Thermoplasmata archaeon]